MKLLVVEVSVVVVSIRCQKLWSLRVEQVSWWLLVMTKVIRWSGFDQYRNFRTSKLIDFAKVNLTAGRSRWCLLRRGSWMTSMRLVSRLLVRQGTKLSLSGLRILLRKSWSNTMFDSSLWHISDFERSQGLHRRAQLSSRQTTWSLGKGVVVRNSYRQAINGLDQ